MENKSIDEIRNETWNINLSEEGQYIFYLIHKYHQYFSKQDKKFRRIARIMRLTILFLTMANTIILGLKTVLTQELQIVLGLVISAIITFGSAVSSYFNIEEYWMRNITTHIDLNVLRDNFVFDAKSGELDDKKKLDKYRDELEEIQKRNIKYWQRALKKIG